jgi:hypothetical protein
MAVSHKQFVRACLNATEKLRELAPKDTGNLAYNAIKIEFKDKDTCVIRVDERIAPYMPYTTLPWASPKWHGRKNPNEGWWDAAVELILEELAKELKGDLNDATKK